MRAISDFSLEAGTSTLGWRAWIAFRTRVSMSAMGSLVIKLLGRLEDRSQKTEVRRPAGAPLRLPTSNFLILTSSFHLYLPASLHHAGDLAVQGELAETETAHAEFTQIGARPAAAPAAVAVADSELGRFGPPGFFQLQIFGDFCGSGHGFLLLLIGGRASPCAATTPGPRHRCGPWW